MLGKEDRMPSHGSLFSVVGNNGWSQTLSNEVGCMLANDVKSFLGNILPVSLLQMELAPEIRPGKPFKQIRKVIID